MNKSAETTAEKRLEILAHLKAFFEGINAISKETHGSERVLDELLGDLDDQIAWEPFSKLPGEITNLVANTFHMEQETYAEAHIAGAKDWVREHRHEKRDRENLAEIFRSAFARDADEADINFDTEDFCIRISKRYSGQYAMQKTRYLSDAEIIEVWEKETTK